MTESSTFLDYTEEIAKRFLQSVVVLDDKIGFDPPPAPQKVITPGRKAISSKDEKTKETVKPESGHSFDAPTVINGFASKGLVCAALNPLLNGEINTDLRQGAIEIGKRADVLILDWQIGKKEEVGESAIEIIRCLLEEDGKGNPHRRRLIVIYTAEPFDQVQTRISNELGCKFDNEFTCNLDATYITILGKGRTSAPDGKSATFDELPSRIIHEFAKINCGLLSNATLKALAEIRENTHRLLNRFAPELDAPFLAHRAMTDPTHEAEFHFLPLFSSEIESMLDGTGIEQYFSMEIVESWIDQNNILQDNSPARIELLNILRHGIEKANDENLKNEALKKIVKPIKKKTTNKMHQLTDLLSNSDDQAESLDLRFSILTSICTSYDLKSPPTLKYGTIVADESDKEKYFLCLTPSCDCRRLDKKTQFLFLKCTSKKPNENFDLIVEPDKEVFHRIKINYSSKNILFHKFVPDKSKKMVLSEKNHQGKWFFSTYSKSQPKNKKTTSDSKKLLWVAELKPAHVRRIVQKFASNISRVGLTESDWLRRSAPNS